MSRATTRAWEMLELIGRYLKGRPRLGWKYSWQAEITVVDVTSDANWAGGRLVRKSTSGGTSMSVSRLIRTYSENQSVIAKSSGESELYAVVLVSTEGLGIITLLKDFGMHKAKVRLGMDASAAIGMAQRTGLNKVRHVGVDVLWIQEQVARRMLPIGKIPGPRNPSDLFREERRSRAGGTVHGPAARELRTRQSCRSSTASPASPEARGDCLPGRWRPGFGAPQGRQRPR